MEVRLQGGVDHLDRGVRAEGATVLHSIPGQHQQEKEGKDQHHQQQDQDCCLDGTVHLSRPGNRDSGTRNRNGNEIEQETGME